MTHHPDKAREAVVLASQFSAIWNQELEDAACAPRMNIGYDPEVVAGKAMMRAYEMGKNAFLAASVPADEKLAEIRERNAKRLQHPEVYSTKDWNLSLPLFEEIDTLLELISALQAKLTAQKAAHAKLLRDEAERCAAQASSFGPILATAAHAKANILRRLADKIEGGA